MTIINKTLSNHLQLVESLHRLSNAILRMNTPLSEPAGSELIEMFEDLSKKDDQFVEKTIDGVKESGDLPKVSEELYNPSSNIFDDNIQTAYFAKPKEKELEEGSGVGGDNISCAAKYVIRNNSKVYAEIKNFHTLQYVDYSINSLVYPILVQDELKIDEAKINDMRYMIPSFTDDLDVTGFIASISYPIKITYEAITISDELTSSAGIKYATFPNKRKEYTLTESVITTGVIYNLELKNGKITYPIPQEGLDGTGIVYAISRY